MSDTGPSLPPPTGRPTTVDLAAPTIRRPGLGLLLITAAPISAFVLLGLALRYSNVDGYSPVENPWLALLFLALAPVVSVGCLTVGVRMCRKGSNSISKLR